jgi:hypothetical protein
MPLSAGAEVLVPRIEADGVVDAMIEAEIETVKPILYYKNYLSMSTAPYPWPIHPLVAALDALDTLDDCAAASTQPTPKSPQW